MTRFQFFFCLICVFVLSSNLYSDIGGQRERWNKATKIGYYEHLPSYDDAVRTSSSSEDVRVGNEYFLWGKTATVILVNDSRSCIIMFHDTWDTFLLEGYPTRDFYEDMHICLASPVECVRISERNMRVLRFIPKSEAIEKIYSFLQDQEDEKKVRRLSASGFRVWELNNGEKFFGLFIRSQSGYAYFKLEDGSTVKYRPKDLSEKDVEVYKKQRLEWQKNEKAEKAAKRNRKSHDRYIDPLEGRY